MAPRQGRKSMFKHGGYDSGVKYTSRLRDVSRGPKRRALLGGFGGMPPPRENFLKGAIWCVLVYIWIRFVFKKLQKLPFFIIKSLKFSFFYIHFLRNTIFSSFFFFRKNYLLLSYATSVRPSVRLSVCGNNFFSR